MVTSHSRRTVALRLAIAALAAGTVLGVAARVLMRLIALEAGLPGSSSVGGSIEVVLFGVMVGSPLAAAFWLLRAQLRWRGPLAGLSLGLLATIMLALFPPPSARSALAATPDTPVLTWFGFWLLLTTWATVLELVTGRVCRMSGVGLRGQDDRAARRRSGLQGGTGGSSLGPEPEPDDGDQE